MSFACRGICRAYLRYRCSVLHVTRLHHFSMEAWLAPVLVAPVLATSVPFSDAQSQACISLSSIEDEGSVDTCAWATGSVCEGS